MSLGYTAWFRFRAVGLVTVVAATVLASVAGRAQTPEFAPQVVIPRAFPPIKDAPVMTAAKADGLLLKDELVIGVVVKGKARAYPINVLTGPQREIVNDTLGGRSIAATW